MELLRCAKCLLPITWETIYFDGQGVCNICRSWEEKQQAIDWKKREKNLLAILQKAKDNAEREGRAYDCIVPFSGGKDSTFTLWTLVRKYGLRPLVVSFDHGFYRPKTIKNRTRTFRKLGVDVVTFTPNWQIVKKLMLESLIRKGDFCWHCHAGVFAYPMKVALRFGIPLLIWGEGGGEYEGYFKIADLEETDEWKFNRRTVLGIRAEDMAGFIGVPLRDLECYVYPTKQELERARIQSIPLGNFIPWDQQKNVELIKKELGWEEDEVESLPGINFDKVECMFTGVRDYIKYLKRGFSRMSHRVAIDIRLGRMTREKAMQLINKYERKKPRSLEVFLEYLGITEDEFNRICLQHIIPPFKGDDPKKFSVGKKLWDQDSWFKDNHKRRA